MNLKFRARLLVLEIAPMLHSRHSPVRVYNSTSISMSMSTSLI